MSKFIKNIFLIFGIVLLLSSCSNNSFKDVNKEGKASVRQVIISDYETLDEKDMNVLIKDREYKKAALVSLYLNKEDFNDNSEKSLYDLGIEYITLINNFYTIGETQRILELNSGDEFKIFEFKDGINTISDEELNKSNEKLREIYNEISDYDKFILNKYGQISNIVFE